MTSTLPARTRRRDGLRRGHVYGYLTITHDPNAPGCRGMGTEFGYGGQSVQRHGVRDRQHRDCQPWEDLIVGSPLVIADGRWTQDELDDIERAVIAGDWARVRRLAEAEAARRGAVANLSAVALCEQVGPRPRYNWVGNEDNPLQIPKWTAVEQRWARDDAAGRPRWQPVEERVRPPLVEPAPVSWPSLIVRRMFAAIARPVSRWWQRVRWWVLLWVLLTVAGSVTGLVWAAVAASKAAGQVPPPTDGAGLGAFTASLVMAAILWVRGKVRARRRKRKRK